MVSITETQADGCAWEPTFPGSLVTWGKDCRGELEKVSRAFCSIRAGFFSQGYVPAEAWAGKPQRGRTGNRACDVLHAVL